MVEAADTAETVMVGAEAVNKAAIVEAVETIVVVEAAETAAATAAATAEGPAN